MMLLTVHTDRKGYEFYANNKEAYSIIDDWKNNDSHYFEVYGIYKEMFFVSSSIIGISLEEVKLDTNVGPGIFNIYRKKTPFDREEETNEESRVSENKAQNQVSRDDEQL